MKEPKEVPVKNFLMWIGFKNYPTIDSYLKEAKKLGVSKRIPFLPEDFESGKTRVFLVHEEIVKNETKKLLEEHSHSAKGNKLTKKRFKRFWAEHNRNEGNIRGHIFGYFVPEKIEVIVNKAKLNPSKKKVYEQWQEKNQVNYISTGEVRKEEERECGPRREGVYIVAKAEVEQEALKDLVKKLGNKAEASAKGMIRTLNPFIPYRDKFFRGIKEVDIIKLSKQQKGK